MADAVLTAIHLHPVKSCRRIEVAEATVAAGGLAGDRMWQLVSDDGKVVTQRRYPVLALVQPALVAGGMRLTGPGGVAVEVADPAAPDRVVRALLGDEVPVADAGDEAAQWFSAVVGVGCRLVGLCDDGARRIPIVAGSAVSLADATPVLVANEASRRDLEARATEPFGMDRFRANLVVDGAAPWAEDTWREFTIGAAQLQGLVPMPRCAMPQVDQDTAERHKEPALAMKAHRWCVAAPSLPEGWQPFFNGQPLFGLGATIGPVGTVVRVGDEVTVASVSAPLIPAPAALA